METLGMALEYGQYPIWLLDSQGLIIDNITAEELGLDEALSSKIRSMQDMYDSLFINNKVAFTYTGENQPETVIAIKACYVEVANAVKDQLGSMYDIQIDEWIV
ncbi:MAG: hypothetical protein Q4A55_05430 [Aerococcus sp.]|nr:hypothetical protein [Aerococcus sp.]